VTAVDELEQVVVRSSSGWRRAEDFHAAALASGEAARSYGRAATDPGWAGKSADAAVEVFTLRSRRLGANIGVLDAAGRIVTAANEALHDAAAAYDELPPSIVPGDVSDHLNAGGAIALGGFGVVSGASGVVFVASVLRWQREQAARRVLDRLNARLTELADRLRQVIEELDIVHGSQPPEAPPFPLARSEAHLTPWQLGVEWVTGKGNDRDFVETDDFTQLLRTHPRYEQIRAELNERSDSLFVGANGDPDYELAGWDGVGKYVQDYSTLLTAGASGNLAVTYLGSHRIHWEVVGQRPNGDWEIEFTATNSSSLQSATGPPVLGYEPWYRDSIGAATDNISEVFGIGRETTQTIKWTETIER
jgi:hypothetical protein